MSITGGIVRGKAVAGYNPTMQTFDGSTGYYSLTTDLSISTGITMICRFRWDGGTITSAGGFNRVIAQGLGPTAVIYQLSIVNDQTGDNRAGTLSFLVQDTAPSNVCSVCTNTAVSDGAEYWCFCEYNPTAGTAKIILNGASDINTGAVDHILTTGTIDTGSGINAIGCRASADRFFNGGLGFIGIHDAVGLDWTDFFDASDNSKQINESAWTEWGSRPLFWHDSGIMRLNKGSAGAMTKNGTITTAAATTAFMGIKNGIVGPVARAVVRSQTQASGLDAYIESLSPAVWYKFDDDSFASTIIDYGSAGADLTKQNATAASAGTPMRLTRSKSISMPAATSTNWSTQAAHYTDVGAPVATIQSGITAFTVAFSVRMAATSVSDDVYLFRLGTNGTTQGAPGFRCMMTNPSLTGALGVQEKHTTGFNYPTSTTTGLDDGDVHFVVVRFGPAAYNLRLDGTEEVTAAWNKTTETTSAPFNLGGVSGISVDASPAWQSDCFAFWPSYLTDTQVATLSTKYLAEIA